MILKAILLPVLIKTLLATRKPLLCAILYGLALFSNDAIFSLAFGANPQKVMAYVALNTLASWGYFYVLKETEDSSLYWGVLAIGAGLLVFVMPG